MRLKELRVARRSAAIGCPQRLVALGRWCSCGRRRRRSCAPVESSPASNRLLLALPGFPASNRLLPALPAWRPAGRRGHDARSAVQAGRVPLFRASAIAAAARFARFAAARSAQSRAAERADGPDRQMARGACFCRRPPGLVRRASVGGSHRFFLRVSSELCGHRGAVQSSTIKATLISSTLICTYRYLARAGDRPKAAPQPTDGTRMIHAIPLLLGRSAKYVGRALNAESPCSTSPEGLRVVPPRQRGRGGDSRKRPEVRSHGPPFDSECPL